MENPPPAPASPPPLVHRSGHPQTDVNMAMWCHLIPVIASMMGFGFFAFLGPLIIRQQTQGRSAFVDQHAKESLNFQLSMLLYLAVLGVISVVGLIVTFGLAFFILIPGFLVIAVGALVLEIIATVKATNGEYFDYKVSIRFIK